ncbi:MAG: hypothetical protein ACI4RG_08525 [Huintestinicola sp.]
MKYYIIMPLYQGDISLESVFENVKVSDLVFELDDGWNGDPLICGTDEFLCEKSLSDKLLANGITGFEISDMTTIYSGDQVCPELKRMKITGEIGIKRNMYTNATADICNTKNVGELAVSQRALEIIQMPVSKELPKYIEKSRYNYFVNTLSSFEKISENLPEGVSVSEVTETENKSNAHTYIVSGENEMKILLFLSCLDSNGTFIGKSQDKMMEFEAFFSLMI